MTHIEISEPTPFCPVPVYHPARAHVGSHQTDVARTLKEHSLADLQDASERTALEIGAINEQ